MGNRSRRLWIRVLYSDWRWFQELVCSTYRRLRERAKTPAGRATKRLTIAALGVGVLALALGYFYPIEIPGLDYKPYYKTYSWSLYPLFFLLVTPLVGVSWSGFIQAWRSLAESNVLREKGEESVAQDTFAKLLRYFRRWRSRLVVVAFSFAAVPAAITAWENAQFAFGFGKMGSYKEQLARTCEDPDFFDKWILEGWKQNSTDPEASPCSRLEMFEVSPQALKDLLAQERDSDPHHLFGFSSLRKLRAGETGLYFQAKDEKWFMVHRVEALVVPPSRANSRAEVAPFGHFILLGLLILEQLAIGTIGALVLLQVLFHACAFRWLDRFDGNLEIRFNWRSPFQEFGLEQWNHALNNVYWFLAVAMVVPIVARFAQRDPAHPDGGVEVLFVLMILLVLVPTMGTIIGRQKYLRACWPEVEEAQREWNPEVSTGGRYYGQWDSPGQAYLAQRLWPLDRNWASKLGIVLAFIMLSVLLGLGLHDLAFL